MKKSEARRPGDGKKAVNPAPRQAATASFTVPVEFGGADTAQATSRAAPCACGGSCPRCSATSSTAKGGRQAVENSGLPAIVNDVLNSPGRPLESATRSYMESRFGENFAGVRVHTDGRAAASARALGARAYTFGSDIVFGRREYAPQSAGGGKLLAHELAHVVQQQGQPPGLQHRLVIGAVNDPAETRADRAAEAVMRGDPVPNPGRFARALRRFPERSCNGNVALIRMSEDSPQHRVTRTQTLEPVTRRRGFGARARVDADSEDVFIAIEWCRGSNGRVRIGADVPEQLAGLLQEMSDIIGRGGGATDVLDALADAEINPFIDFDIADLGRHVRGIGSVQVNVGAGGFGGVTLGGGIRIDDFNLRGEVILGPDGEPVGGGVVLGGTIPEPGGPNEDCEEERVVMRARTSFSCEELVPEHEVTETVNVPVQDRAVRTVFFNHAQSTVNHALSDPELAQLQQQLNDGFSVVRIEGFTSPEGRQGPPDATTGDFQGNDQLSLERAQAAQVLARAACPEGPADVPAGHCGIDNVQLQASSELLTLTEPAGDGGEREVEGQRLEDHVVREFMVRDSEARYRTAQTLDEIARAPTTDAKAEVVYRRLRRVEIELIRNRIEPQQQTRTVPATSRAVPCRDDVLQEARRCFRRGTGAPGPRRRR